MAMIKGSCLCGDVQYELTDEPFTRSMCFCDNCRKTSGSIGMANSIYERESLKITKGADVIRTYKDNATDSENTVLKSFCPNCGSPLFAANPDFQDRVLVTYGTMEVEEGQTWRPDRELYCKRKLNWVGKVPKSTKFEEMPFMPGMRFLSKNHSD